MFKSRQVTFDQFAQCGDVGRNKARIALVRKYSSAVAEMS